MLDVVPGFGNVFELSNSSQGWVYTDLYSFSIDDEAGSFPYGSMVFTGRESLRNNRTQRWSHCLRCRLGAHALALNWC